LSNGKEGDVFFIFLASLLCDGGGKIWFWSGFYLSIYATIFFIKTKRMGTKMDLGLKDKVAIVSGGNKGLGAACAMALAAEGAKIFLTARNEEDLASVSAAIKAESSVETGTLAVDVTEEDAGDKIVAAALAQFGQVDVLVNGAGAARGGSFLTVEDQVWRDAFELKFMGAVRYAALLSRICKLKNMAGSSTLSACLGVSLPSKPYRPRR
jgi:short-subunit dehydrogenase involved in D-alanine esterification of teichoic acids